MNDEVVLVDTSEAYQLTREVEESNDETRPLTEMDSMAKGETGTCLRRRIWMLLLGLALLSGLLMFGFLFSSLSPKAFSPPSELSSVCFSDFDDMPKEWQPPENLPFPASVEAWSEEEQYTADTAVMTAYWQMFIFFSGLNETEIEDLWDNGVEAFLDSNYAGDLMPELQMRSLQQAVHNFKIISKDYVYDGSHKGTCRESDKYIDLAIYAHILSIRSPDDQSLQELKQEIVQRTNKMLDSCRALPRLVHFDPVRAMSKENQSADTVYNWLMWSIVLVDALRIPGLQLPNDTDRLIADTWEYLKIYPFPPASSYPKNYKSYSFRNRFYLLTHSAYLPTGYGRHELKVEDAPWIFKYIRENFYNAMLSGDNDLFSEIVDLLRCYGCSEETDAHLRHGTRYLLHTYEENGYGWVPRESHDEGSQNSTYNILHASWTGMSGLRRRVFEPVVPGSYGAMFQDIIDRWSKKTDSAAGGPGE